MTDAATHPAATAALARRLLSMLDLTDLSDAATEAQAAALCEAARGPHGPVAAVCLWPQFVPVARQILRGSPVRIATVANFPAGGTNTTRILDDVVEAIDDGADEIDLVMPWRAFLDGEADLAREMIENVRDQVRDGKILKVILETGAYPDMGRVADASRLALAAGADFLKTSTGKTPVSATLPSAKAMLEVIREAGGTAGFKASGGIRTLEDAAAYLALADSLLGEGWATPATFRIGASALHGALVAAIVAGDLPPDPAGPRASEPSAD